jgi:hypothetical protein
MSVRFNIVIKPISDVIEKFVIKNLNKRAPMIYSKISEKELDGIYRKTVNNFPDSKDELSTDLIKSMRNSWTRNHMIKYNKNLYKNSKKIIGDYNKKKLNVLQICKSYDVSPLNLLREIFDRKYHKKLSKLIMNPEILSEYDLIQLNLAIENDVYALIDQSQIQKDSEKFELDIKKILDQNNIKYKTQEELVVEQIKNHGMPINTPDFLIKSDLYINGRKINWIDAKNFYGSNVPFVSDKIKKQTEKYVKTWGPGSIIFSLGFNEKLHYNNIILIDYRELEKN